MPRRAKYREDLPSNPNSQDEDQTRDYPSAGSGVSLNLRYTFLHKSCLPEIILWLRQSDRCGRHGRIGRGIRVGVIAFQQRKKCDKSEYQAFMLTGELIMLALHVAEQLRYRRQVISILC